MSECLPVILPQDTLHFGDTVLSSQKILHLEDSVISPQRNTSVFGYPFLKQELDVFEKLLYDQFSSKKNVNSYLDNLCIDIIKSGGKRLRPAMVIASSMLGNYDREKSLQAAISVELLHTATLVHDDIIDESSVRRGISTVNASDGIDIAVFTGDYLYIKSIMALSGTGISSEYMKQLALATEAVCAGEVEQFRGRGSLPGIKTYLSRIIRKTGFLFAACSAVGAKLGGLSDNDIKYTARFGSSFGAAFQIKDDLLDITSDQNCIGKPACNDIKEGIFTLPVLLAAAKDCEIKKLLSSLMIDYQQIIRRVKDAGGITDAEDVLKKYVRRSRTFLYKLRDNEGRKMLEYILDTTFNDYI